MIKRRAYGITMVHSQQATWLRKMMLTSLSVTAHCAGVELEISLEGYRLRRTYVLTNMICDPLSTELGTFELFRCLCLRNSMCQPCRRETGYRWRAVQEAQRGLPASRYCSEILKAAKNRFLLAHGPIVFSSVWVTPLLWGPVMILHGGGAWTEQMAYLMSQKTKWDRKGLGPMIFLKGISQWSKQSPTISQ